MCLRLCHQPVVDRRMSLPLPYSQPGQIPGSLPKKERQGPNRTSKTSNKLKVLPSAATPIQQQQQQPGLSVSSSSSTTATSVTSPGSGSGVLQAQQAQAAAGTGTTGERLGAVPASSSSSAAASGGGAAVGRKPSNPRLGRTRERDAESAVLLGDEEDDEESGLDLVEVSRSCPPRRTGIRILTPGACWRQFYNPIAQIPAGTARRDALRLTKTEKSKLPRVTAYCTAA